jgi:hypothetical protein
MKPEPSAKVSGDISLVGLFSLPDLHSNILLWLARCGSAAINHCREEEATPIRLFSPGDVGPPPAGNECTIQDLLSASQAEEIARRLLDACYRREA